MISVGEKWGRCLVLPLSKSIWSLLTAVIQVPKAKILESSPFFRHFSKESVRVSLRSNRKSKSVLEENASLRLSRATCRVLALEWQKSGAEGEEERKKMRDATQNHAWNHVLNLHECQWCIILKFNELFISKSTHWAKFANLKNSGYAFAHIGISG